MRFVYIDSQGKEVSIPSADGLRLRIELGAIVDGTMFHDVSADKWAPASDHEIYRTLKREVDGDDGASFVAPPPPSISFPDLPVEEAPSVPAETVEDEPVMDMAALEPEASAEEPITDMSALQPEAPQEEPVAEEPVMDMPALEPEAPAEPEAEGSDFSSFGDLTLDDGLGAEVEGAPSRASVSGMDDSLDFDLGGLSVADDDDDDGADEADEAVAAGSDSDDDAGFDMGSFGDLALAEEEPDEEEEPASWNVAADLAGEIPGADFGQDEPTPQTDVSAEFGGDLETFDSGDSDDGPPSWLADDSPESAASGPASAASGAQHDSPVDEDGFPTRPTAPERDDAPRPRRTPPPKRKLTPAGSGGAGKILGFVVILAAVGAGGWFGFQTLMSGGGEADDESAVVLPEIPTNLEPQLRQLAARANLYMVDAMQALPERAAILDAPPAEWLLGVYLANASRYPQVVEYWESYQDLLREVRARDDQFFEEGFRAELQAANVSATNSDLLDTRAVAGFDAALPDRQLVYDQLQGVITGALDLHRFLVENEADINYEPASGGLSRDPVLEAVPVTETLGDEMLTQMGQISSAMDQLGFLDRVTTEQLLAVFFEKLQVTAIR